MKRVVSLAACAALAACTESEDLSAITLSVIGATAKIEGSASGTRTLPTAVLTNAIAQGLVGFDAKGRVEPALAERWIVIDGGRSLIFRIRHTVWSDGREVTSADVVDALKRAIASNQRYAGLFSNVDQIVAMTGQVVQITLKTPQPALLQLLAHPEMALFRAKTKYGSGPYRFHSAAKGVTRLRLAPILSNAEAVAANERDDVRIRGERASVAIARFVSRDASLVLGGTFVDLPLARTARISANEFQVDPAYGLFGLAFVSTDRALQPAKVRAALAMVIDRERLVRSFGVNNWRPAYTILPDPFEAAKPPAALDWAQLSFENRLVLARRTLSEHRDLPVLRIALPKGPGARLLFAALVSDWSKVGVEARLVDFGAPSDLRLIDEVAPMSSATWYFDRLSCARGLPCSEAGETAFKAALSTTSLDDRAISLAEADAAFSINQPYIPLALPLRWALVAPRLSTFSPSAFAVHPLTQLRP